MKKQATHLLDRERNDYRREATDRLKNRPTFDPFFGHYWLEVQGQTRDR